MIKILLLNYTDAGGGGAIAPVRLLTLLHQNNIEVALGVIDKKTIISSVFSITKKSSFDRFEFFRIINKLYRNIYEFYRKSIYYLKRIIKIYFHTSNTIIHSENKKTLLDLNYINNSDYDLVHLHWINNDMISIEDIAKIKKPIIWTIHDTWVFCGAEHYPNILENDQRFIEGYTKKNKPKTTFGPDICRRTWERKQKSWKSIRFNFISPSRYEKESCDKSALFRDTQSTCTVIPNVVPKNIFRPLDKNILREIYQIPLEKKVIGFGAAYNVSNKISIKGSYLLLETLKKIFDKTKYHLVIFGDNNISFTNEIKLPLFATGYIVNPYILAGIYNLCDVFVCPSLLENLPNVCLESLFCGIPVAAFNTGGIPDIVEHKKTGYLARCFDTEDLYNGIQYCIENKDELSRNSLEKAHIDFDEEIIARKHIELYETVLKGYQS